MDDRTYDIALIERAAAATIYPVTPQLRGRVLASIASAAAPATPTQRRPALAFAVTAAAVAIFGAIVALSIPSSRSAIADFFGIEGSRIERLPTPAPGVTPTPFPPAAELPPGARSASLAEVEDALGFAAALPEGRTPCATYLVDYSGDAVAILRYDGFDIWQARPRGVIFAKGLPEGVIFLEIMVGAYPAYYIQGGPHTVVLLDDEDGEIPGSRRVVARNTLIFNTGYALYRIETDMPRSPELIRLAESLP